MPSWQKCHHGKMPLLQNANVARMPSWQKAIRAKCHCGTNVIVANAIVARMPSWQKCQCGKNALLENLAQVLMVA
jgi:hypothetical protein